MTVSEAINLAKRVRCAAGRYVLPPDDTTSEVGEALSTLQVALSRYRKITEEFRQNIADIEEGVTGTKKGNTCPPTDVVDLDKTADENTLPARSW